MRDLHFQRPPGVVVGGAIDWGQEWASERPPVERAKGVSAEAAKEGLSFHTTTWALREVNPSGLWHWCMSRGGATRESTDLVAHPTRVVNLDRD